VPHKSKIADGRHLEKLKLADFDDLCVIWRVSVQGCVFRVSLILLLIYGVKFLKTPTLGREWAFSNKRTKHPNFHIIKTNIMTPTKFRTMIKTSKYSSLVVPIRDP